MASSIQSRLGFAPEEGIKAPVRVETTANITLSGHQTVNGVLTTDNMRVLAKNQTDASENGIYLAGQNAWVRASDMDASDDVENGVLIVSVETTSIYRISTTDPWTPGTTAITFPLTTVQLVSLSDFGSEETVSLSDGSMTLGPVGGANYVIRQRVDDETLQLVGGIALGGKIILFGPSDGTAPSGVWLVSDNNNFFEWDESAGTLTIKTGNGGSKPTAFQLDDDATAGNTRMLLYDVDAGAVVRVSVGANDSGGSGFKVLRVPN